MLSFLSLEETSVPLGETNLIAIVNSVFHVLDFWRLFIISFEYGSI